MRSFLPPGSRLLLATTMLHSRRGMFFMVPSSDGQCSGRTSILFPPSGWVPFAPSTEWRGSGLPVFCEDGDSASLIAQRQLLPNQWILGLGLMKDATPRGFWVRDAVALREQKEAGPSHTSLQRRR